ncbi:MAG: ATP-binding protein [Bacteroidales bacterium]|nr:ATP-binding protein [Bacteroidales bacterium]
MTEIAILSGKGGTGKSTLCASFATMEHDIVVADCDVDAADMYLVLFPEDYVENNFITGYKARLDQTTCTKCGLCIDKCRFRAISMIDGDVTISDTSCDGCKLCSRICPTQSITMIPSDKSCWYVGNYRNGKLVHARLDPGEENSGKLVSIVREKARKLIDENNWKCVIIDGPPGVGCPVIASITGVDKVVVVTEPTNSGFHDLKRIMELINNYRINPYVVINKSDLNIEISREIRSWCDSNGICLAGAIPFDEQVVQAMINCRSVVEWSPESEVSLIIKSIWEKVNKD